MEDENMRRSELPYKENKFPYRGEHFDIGDERPPYIDTKHPYMESEHPYTGMEHPYLVNGGGKRSNIIIPFQNFVVSDEKTANKILDATKESLGSSKKSDNELMRQMYRLEFARQLKMQRQRDLDLQRLQDLYIRTSSHEPMYHHQPLAYYHHEPRYLYEHPTYLQPSYTSHGFYGGRQLYNSELRERSRLAPILNAYRYLIKTPIKDFMRALHLGREAPVVGFG